MPSCAYQVQLDRCAQAVQPNLQYSEQLSELIPLAAGLVGYSYAAESHPDLPPELYEAILPSNQAMLNRSVYANASSQYNLTSWVPQVAMPVSVSIKCHHTCSISAPSHMLYFGLQVVLVTSGTNDWHSVPPLYTLEDWLTDATAFLAQVWRLSAALSGSKCIVEASASCLCPVRELSMSHCLA